MDLYIYPDVTNVINNKSGPIVGMKLLQSHLLDIIKETGIDNVHVTNTYSTIHNSIVWHWNVFSSIDEIKSILNRGNTLICGPNTFFSSPSKGIREHEAYIFDCGQITEFMLHPKQYSKYSTVYSPLNTIHNFYYPVDVDKIRTLLKNNDTSERDIDVLIYCKFNYQKYLEYFVKRYTGKLKIEVVFYGSYDPEQLIKLASRSKCCLYLSYGETGGIAVCEILCCGCPIIGYNENLNLAEHQVNCYKLTSNDDIVKKPEEFDNIIETVMTYNNASIMKNAQEKYHPRVVAIKTLETLGLILRTKYTLRRSTNNTILNIACD